LISGVTCDAPYEWSDRTDSEWEFKKNQSSETFHVSIGVLPGSLPPCTIKIYLGTDVGLLFFYRWLLMILESSIIL
jgi:hypothetical protein